jgi:pimeloyl-ACP methyl ester carboxylesterase
MDYRGAGRSDRPSDPKQYSFAILASDADAIRNHLGISKWAVFGHSNGGATAITYATKFSAFTAALILCDPLLSPVDLDMNMIHKVAFAPPDKFEEARAIYKSNKGDDEKFGQLINVLGQQGSYRLQFFDPHGNDVLADYQNGLKKELGKGLMEPALWTGLLASGFFKFNAYNLVDKLPMPTLLLLGRFDNEISVDNAMKFAMTLSDGHIAVLEHSGHHPYLEETKSSAEKVNAFLAKR